jgi:hypothetical protein
MRRLAFLFLLLWTLPAAAQTVVTSPGPDGVSVTVYRDQNRSEGGEVNLRWLQGYALITETRTVRVPEGMAQIRFEGVAEGIIPVSVIVTGLPGGVVQKNRDAQILSPAALINGSLGNRVMLRRTNRKTGKVDEQDAVLRAGPNQGVILETRDGFEALRCSGVNEAMVYDRMPEGLSAKPTLSVLTRSPRAANATITLSYLARNFDWAANYVAQVDPSTGTMTLSAWLTLANGNGESFRQANTQAVAGTVNRDRNAKVLEQPARAPQFIVRCWPMDITSTHPSTEFERLEMESMARNRGDDGDVMYEMAPAPMAVSMSSPAPEGMVARKTMVAKQEELGDLKLYRIPERVTVAANAQKQVALMDKHDVPYERIYTFDVNVDDRTENATFPTPQLLRLKNTQKLGLGLPLPSGGVAVFESVGDRSLLVGRAPMRDSAVGEKVEIKLEASAQVRWSIASDQGSLKRRKVALTNANPYPVTVEGVFTVYDGQVMLTPSEKLGKKDGRPMWRVVVPANGTASMSYGVR